MVASSTTARALCLISVMRIERSVLKSASGASKFIGVLDRMSVKLQSKLGAFLNLLLADCVVQAQKAGGQSEPQGGCAGRSWPNGPGPWGRQCVVLHCTEGQQTNKHTALGKKGLTEQHRKRLSDQGVSVPSNKVKGILPGNILHEHEPNPPERVIRSQEQPLELLPHVFIWQAQKCQAARPCLISET
eukprot:1159131-Pelagomonas_calceolata.AAC.2